MSIRQVLAKPLRYFLLSPLLILRGRHLCVRMFPDGGVLYVFPYQAIGDIMVTLGFLEEYARKNAFARTVIFCTGEREELCSFYDFLPAQRKVVPAKAFTLLKRFFSTPQGLSYLIRKRNILFTDTACYLQGSWKTTFSVPGLTVFSYIKCGIMGLGKESRMTLPHIKKANVSRSAHGDAGKRIAVLNPSSNTIRLTDSERLWRRISDELEESGFTAIYDSGATLAESFAACMDAELIIGARSGWLDLMALTGKTIIAVYPDGADIYMNAFDINALNDISGRTVNGNMLQVEAKDALPAIKKITALQQQKPMGKGA